jgi:diacylglycerol kinase family enzyme
VSPFDGPQTPPVGGAAPWVILHNTGSGTRTAVTTTEDIRAAACRARLPAAVEPFDRAEDLLECLEAHVAAGRARIAVAAGDSTCAAAAARLAHRPGVTLGLVPVGGANHFARSARVPTHIDDALANLRDGEPQPVSLGQVVCAGREEGRFFAETAGIGLFADGLAAYGDADESLARGVFAITRIFLNLCPQPFRVTLDGHEMETPVVMIAVANGPRFADSLPVAPGARVDDDVLDVVVFGDIHRREALSHFNALRRCRHLRDTGKIMRHRAREVRLEPVGDTPDRRVYADDAVIGATPAVFTLHPAAVQIVAPPRRRGHAS